MKLADESTRDVLRQMGKLGVPTDIGGDPGRQHRVAATIDLRLEQLSREKLGRQRRLRLAQPWHAEASHLTINANVKTSDPVE